MSIVWSTETGTWNPAFAGSATAGVFTYSIQTGIYTRLGNLVHISGRLTISAIATPPSGIMKITGLPFTISNVANLSPPLTIAFGGVNFPTASPVATCLGVPNSTEAWFFRCGSGVTPIPSISATDFTSAADIIINGSYLADGVA